MTHQDHQITYVLRTIVNPHGVKFRGQIVVKRVQGIGSIGKLAHLFWKYPASLPLWRMLGMSRRS